jgi:hypothetical protein
VKPAINEEVRVEGVQLSRSEVSELETSYPGHDVAVDHLGVVVVSTGSDARPNCREPLVDQERSYGRLRRRYEAVLPELVTNLGIGLLGLLAGAKAAA